MGTRVKAHWAADIKRHSGFRNLLEAGVAKCLDQQEVEYGYESKQIAYVRHAVYVPDFVIDDVHIEVKGYWPSGDRQKLLWVVSSNPGIRLFVALHRPHTKISKSSKTTYAQWCGKHAIPWCPLPIPQNFLWRWLRGDRPTY